MAFFGYIAQDNPEAAVKVARSIVSSIEKLADFPRRGRNGSEPGTRELILAPLPYVVVYRVSEEDVEILHIWHGAQDWR